MTTCPWVTKIYYFHNNIVSSLLGFLKIVDVHFILHILFHFYVLLKSKGEPRKKVMPQPGNIIIHIYTLPRVSCSLHIFFFQLTQGQNNECLIIVFRTLFLISELKKLSSMPSDFFFLVQI